MARFWLVVVNLAQYSLETGLWFTFLPALKAEKSPATGKVQLTGDFNGLSRMN